MFEWIIEADKAIIVEINSWHTPRLDDFFYIFTGQKIWFLSAIFIIFFIIKTYRLRALWILLAVALVITLADQISSGLIKPLVERLRPSYEPSLEGALDFVRGYRSGGYSFVSSHAANSFGFALLSSLMFRNRLYSWTIHIWACLTGFSRIYLSVHYPSDVVAGALVGILGAWAVYWLLKMTRPLILDNTMSQSYAKLVSGIMLLTSLVILLFGNSLVFLR